MDDSTRQLEQHYSETAPSLLAYFRRRKETAAVADDLVQETFLRAWRQPERLQAAVSPRAYLFGIARHLALDVGRRGPSTEPLPEELREDAPEPADERLELMRTAIAALPEAQREPLRLKLQHELSYAEISEVLSLPIGTVRSRLHYAVQRLQEQLCPADKLSPSRSKPRGLDAE